jgi:hypothetical protein
LQGFDHGGRQSCELEALMRHRWTFSVHRFLYVTIDEGAEVHPLFCREGLTKENNGSE